MSIDRNAENESVLKCECPLSSALSWLRLNNDPWSGDSKRKRTLIYKPFLLDKYLIEYPHVFPID